MAGALRGLHRRGAGCRRNRNDLHSGRSCGIPPRLLGGSNPAHESGAQRGASRPLQDDRIQHRIQGALMMNPDISLAQLSVLGSNMAYRRTGRSDAPVALFLHGNPTSSYIWRNIIPHAAPVANCIAPDLIGFGQSGKPEIAYRFEDHVRYLDAFIAAASVEQAYLVAQDWGAALAFHLAACRPEFVRGLAFMEFIRPMPTWEDFHQVPAARETFRKFRTPGEGERMILDSNAFVERVLPGAIKRQLSEEEFAVYRAPFLTRESRRPTWRL